MKKTIFTIIILLIIHDSICKAEIIKLGFDGDTVSAEEIINSIRSASYEDEIVCEKLYIAGHLDFKKSGIDTVKCKLNFNTSTFLKSGFFASDVIFKNVIIFVQTTFDYKVEIKNSKFENIVLFSKATFKSYCFIDSSYFNDDVDFASSAFVGPLIINQTCFKDTTSFHNASFGNLFQLENVTFYKLADFEYTQFNKQALFIEVNFKSKADFFRANFYDYANLRGNFYSECDFGETRFDSNADLRYAEFFNDAKIKLDNMTYDKLLIRWDQIFGKIYFSDTKIKDQTVIGNRNTLSEFEVDEEEIISVYNALEKNFQKISRYTDRDACYVKRRNIIQNKLKNQLKGILWPPREIINKIDKILFPYLQSKFLSITCNYGTKPIKILICYFIVVLIMTFICFVYDYFNVKKIKMYFPYNPSFLNSFLNNLYLPITLVYGKKFSFSNNNNRIIFLLFVIEGILQWSLITLLIICLSSRLF